MANEPLRDHGARTAGEEPAGSSGGLIGWMLLPLVPSLIFVAYFLISGKIVT